MRLKIRRDEEYKKFCKIFRELNKAQAVLSVCQWMHASSRLFFNIGIQIWHHRRMLSQSFEFKLLGWSNIMSY
jgi:hypothetical protein